MGSNRYQDYDFTAYAKTTKNKTTGQIFTRRTIDPALDPRHITVRESCDSAVNPNSTPIAIFMDETGSMGEMATIIAKQGLGTIMKEVTERKPVTDPHFAFGAFGDLLSDQHPFQITQFEGGVPEMTPQLEKIYLEKNGGGNHGESPDLAWFFCATRTRTDSFLKRGKKGFLFTVSDEPTPHGLRKDLLVQKTGMIIERDMTPEEVVAMASREWELFHIFLEQGRYNYSIPAWQKLLPERILVAPDYTKLAEIVVSTLQYFTGSDAATVANSWSGDTSLVVANALKGITPRDGGVGSAVVRF